jgi:FkbM family methyltransferase
MEIDPHDWMDCAFYLGAYDPCLIKAINLWVKPGDVCIDIGAHKGYVTLFLARAVGPTGHVYAFEPDPRAREFLERHCQRNGLRNVKTLPYALGERSGTGHLFLSSQLGWSSKFPNEIAKPTIQEQISVPLRTLDDLVEAREINLDLKRLRFVKVDAEGSEPLILLGMRRVLLDSSPFLAMEVNHGSLAAAGFCATGLQGILQQSGFCIYVPRCSRPLFIQRFFLEPLRDINTQVVGNIDILAVKKDVETTIQTWVRNGHAGQA